MKRRKTDYAISKLLRPEVYRLAAIVICLCCTATLAYGIETPKSTTPPAKLAVKTYTYKWIGKPDPFKPFIELNPAPAAKKGPPKRAFAGPISPLQRIDLSSLRIVGIVGNDQKRKAIVEDSLKKFYPIQVGTYIGMNNGIIKEILADRVIVEEKTTDLGRTKTNLITMKLHKNDDEGRP